MKLEDAKTRDPGMEPARKRKLRASAYTDDYVGEYYNIPIDKLIPFKKQARRVFDQASLEALAATIIAHGIRQPLTIVASKEEEGKYEIVSGERRYRAALLAGKSSLPCIILSDYKQASEVAIIENIQREDLHPIELMQAYSNLFEEKVCSSMQEVADKVGASKSSVVEIMNLRKLSKAAQALLLEHRIVNRDLIRVLVKAPVKDQEEMIQAFCSKDKIKKVRKGTRRRVVSVVIGADGLPSIEQMKSGLLTFSQKVRVKEILEGICAQILL